MPPQVGGLGLCIAVRGLPLPACLYRTRLPSPASTSLKPQAHTPRPASAGQLAHAVALLEAAQGALHYGEPSVSALLAAAQELLSLVKLGEGAMQALCRLHAAACSRPAFAC